MGFKSFVSRSLLACVIVLISLYQVKIFASSGRTINSKISKYENSIGLDLTALKAYSNEMIYVFALLGVFSGILLLFHQSLVRITFFLFIGVSVGFNLIEIPYSYFSLKSAVINGTINTSLLGLVAIYGAILETE